VTVVRPLTVARPISITREGRYFRFSFAFDPDLVARVKTLPYALFDNESRTWSAPLSTQAMATLRTWYLDGLLDVDAATLVDPTEEIRVAPPASLSAGTSRRPYLVRPAGSDDNVFNRLKAVPGARWERNARAFSYPAPAAAALADLVARQVVADPQQLLAAAAITVRFDPSEGRFKVTGDERAAAWFHKGFPTVDVVTEWQTRGLDVALADPFSAEVYASERTRVSDGFQPEGLLVDLYDYQKVDVATLVARRGMVLASEPGLGKTAVAVAAAHEIVVNRNEATRVIVVCPGAVRGHWAAEIARFTGATAAVVDGDATRRGAAYDAADGPGTWLVVHYDVLARDIDRLGPLAEGCVLVVDEAHRAKDPQAKRTKAVRDLVNRAEVHWALTGTPVENSPAEWHAVLSGVAVPGLFGPAGAFLNRYSYPGTFGGFHGARNLDELRRRSAPHLIRRRKADVAAHLPPLRTETTHLDPDAAYAGALRRVHRDAKDEIAAARNARAERRTSGLVDGYERGEIEAGAEMTAVGQLKLLCCSPRLLWRSDSDAAKTLCEAGVVPDIDGPKLDTLRELLAEWHEAGERVVVFCSSRRMIDLIAERLVTDGIPWVRYAGDSSTVERDAAVTAFITPPSDDDRGPTVFLSTDAGAEGLNLGKCCSTVVNVDLPWTASRAWQRANRVHRVDGDVDRRYLVVNLVLRGTIEEGILKMLETKADLADALFGEHDGRLAVSGRRGRNLFTDALSGWKG
jgi:SNF2 family DNA or RNA helicase